MTTSLIRKAFPASLTGNGLLLIVVAFIVVTANRSFFARTLADYTLDRHNALALALLPVALGAATALLLGSLAFGRMTKPVLTTALLIAASAAYFMDSFGVVINDEMLQNLAQTHLAEVHDLVNIRLLGYLLLLGVLPSWLLLRVPLHWAGWRREVLHRLLLLAGCVAVLAAIGFVAGGFYASFIREHKAIRSYANPSYPVYSAVKFARSQLAAGARGPVTPIGVDARRPADDTHHELVIMVLGETARADRFSLNGYTRPTNPLLSREAVVSFTNVSACGTSTAVSVPCMFSGLGRADFSNAAALQQENVLDIIQRTGAYVLWLDNNSDSKGVASRIPFRSFRSHEHNPLCDEECRDEGMLAHLQTVIDAHSDGDILIVLHQMGNHGPAYYKRYPPAFEKFKPACRNNDLSQCSIEEIGNAYDNAIVFTDHFLAQTIALLKHNNSRFETALVYFSDHGESLGENGIFLHGLPYALAPREQIHVPAILWFGTGFDEIDVDVLQRTRDRALTHDHLFHTLLGFFEVETSVYRPELDILRDAKRPRHP